MAATVPIPELVAVNLAMRSRAMTVSNVAEVERKAAPAFDQRQSRDPDSRYRPLVGHDRRDRALKVRSGAGSRKDQFITTVKRYDGSMQKMQIKLTSQGQVSVPARVRNFLHLIPGSVLVWTQEGDRIVVERAKRHSAKEVDQALFSEGPPPSTGPARTLVELKQGIREHMLRRHAGR